MRVLRNLTCIVCPLGCSMEVTVDNGIIDGIKGYKCKRGQQYSTEECISPKRVLTTTVKVKNGEHKLVSVKSEKPLPREIIFECMKVLNSMECNAPIKIGDVVIENILYQEVNIVATSNIEFKNVKSITVTL